jgi:hypothetical protein
MALGKDSNLYLLDRSNLGGVGATTIGTQSVLNGEISNATVFATIGGSTYVVARPNSTGNLGVNCMTGSGDIVGVKLDMTAANKMSTIWCANSGGNSSPVITSSDGTKDALVWVAGAEGDNQLHAIERRNARRAGLGGRSGGIESPSRVDLLTGHVVFGGGGAADQIPNVRHFTTVIAADGRVVVAGDDRAYSLHP